MDIGMVIAEVICGIGALGNNLVFATFVSHGGGWLGIQQKLRLSVPFLAHDPILPKLLDAQS